MFKSKGIPLSFQVIVATSLLHVCKSSNPRFEDCALETYYAEFVNDGQQALFNDKELLSNLVERTHRHSLPYTSSSVPDVWDGLIDVDGRNTTSGGRDVYLIYSDIYVPAEPKGTSSTWNREHVWPKSLGVGTSGADYTDIHSLRPADATVNSARGNDYFGTCGIVDLFSNCVQPAHPEAEQSTETDSMTFAPPTSKRGDLARAIFYMALRYKDQLSITDCPDYDSNPNQMAYLSQLLQWHDQDPPDEEELIRNERVCSHWQGNRNPFVDYPLLVSQYYGVPKDPIGNGLGYDCSIPQTDTDTVPKDFDTDISGGSCHGLTAGDVMITGFNSDNPDDIQLLALTDIPPGTNLFMTDAAWTGTSFQANEGTIHFVVPNETTISKGTLFGFSADSNSKLPFANDWTGTPKVQLATSGDAIFVYCTNSTQNENNAYVFLSALTNNPSGWNDNSNKNNDDLTTSESFLPRTLPETYVTTLPHQDNYRYVGSIVGEKDELTLELSNPLYWEGSNSTRWDFPSPQSLNSIRSVSTSMKLSKHQDWSILFLHFVLLLISISSFLSE